MPSKSNGNHGSKGPQPGHRANKKNRKQEREDEFEKLLSSLSRVTKQAGLEKSKLLQMKEQQRKHREETHHAILEKKNQNELQAELLRQRRETRVQKLFQQLLASQRSFLSRPNTDFHCEVFSDDANFGVVVGYMQGWRAAMEDAHLIDLCFPPNDRRASSLQEGKEEEQKHTESGAWKGGALFAVFDGHSGKTCAERCRDWMAEVAQEHLNLDSGLVDFTEAYLHLDQRLAGVIQDDSGCTAVTVHITARNITCASVGDSRAVLCRRGAAFNLSYDHKPDLEEEKARITAAGGFVQDNRVNGQLAMSRAMGDFTYKSDENLSVRKQLVIAVPDVITIEREETDNFLVLACDGIFDVLSNEELVDFIQLHKENGLGNKAIAEAVCRRCLAPLNEKTGQPIRADGTDNMTILIVDFIK